MKHLDSSFESYDGVLPDVENPVAASEESQDNVHSKEPDSAASDVEACYSIVSKAAQVINEGLLCDKENRTLDTSPSVIASTLAAPCLVEPGCDPSENKEGSIKGTASADPKACRELNISSAAAADENELSQEGPPCPGSLVKEASNNDGLTVPGSPVVSIAKNRSEKTGEEVHDLELGQAAFSIPVTSLPADSVAASSDRDHDDEAEDNVCSICLSGYSK